MTLKIGLTGGIGTGKTAVSDRFAALGAPIIDTDLISRQLVAPGQAALTEIAERFGPGLITATGELDRRALREIAFDDAGALRELEAILHPRIRAEVLRQVTGITDAYAIIVVPLLFEAGFEDLIDRVLVVDAPEQIQRERVLRRDGSDPVQVDRILATQINRAARLARADDVIDNSGELAALDAQVRDLHDRYRNALTD
ncbi:MAG: dephospho-CoA kinase [Chromatiales bacterium]|nr:dephospho-CoA kinase [Chromatiales bacterium]